MRAVDGGIGPAPALLMLNEELVTRLGVDAEALREPAGVALLAGNAVPDGCAQSRRPMPAISSATMCPSLGDGRALLLGELIDGRTAPSRPASEGLGSDPVRPRGDGKAAVGPMLREYMMGEAMHALGIPTSRALAVVATGEQVCARRCCPARCSRGSPRAMCASARSSTPPRRRPGARPQAGRLRDRAPSSRRWPRRENPYLGFIERVVDAQASLVARWMLVGFVHGVMNTDNMTISGRDHRLRPCAFMDAFDPATVFSSIDHGGRYAYGNQPRSRSGTWRGWPRRCCR